MKLTMDDNGICHSLNHQKVDAPEVIPRKGAKDAKKNLTYWITLHFLHNRG